MKSQEVFDIPINDTVVEIIPGMREQGKAVDKLYVESDYAPCHAVMVGNPSSIIVPDPRTWEFGNLVRYESEFMKRFWWAYGGMDMKNVDVKLYDQMVKESDALADAYRQAGVTVVRNETGHTPPEVMDYTYPWSRQPHMSLFGQSAGEVIGHCFVQMWETSISWTEFVVREAMMEIFHNDPEAVWLTMPLPYPITTQKSPGPVFSPGDPRIFDKLVVCGIGVGDPSHVKDRSKPRTSCDELGVNMLKRMLEPFGWKVETVYFDANYGYHIDCVLGVFEEGLMAMAEGSLFTPLPRELQDWEVVPVSVEEVHDGCLNCVPLGNKRIVLLEDTATGKFLSKRGWEVIEVPYRTIYNHIGSGIHCSTLALHRE